MALVIAGIDEAGYGPMLGPLTVGLSVIEVPESGSGGAGTVPDLWKLLEAGVCREPSRGGKTDSLGRVAIADSKRLKLSNSVKSTHPLVHLERGVLAMLRVAGADVVSTDEQLLTMLGAKFGHHPYYGGFPTPLPIAQDSASIGIGANVASRAMQASGVKLLAMRCRLVAETEFNDVIRTRGNKAATSAGAIAEHLRWVWSTWSNPTPECAHASAGGQRLGIVCDRLGGRANYADFLRWALRAEVEVIEESDTRSRYVVTDGDRRAGVAFVVGADGNHFPVALASMIAKYVRELSMVRFNRYWEHRAAEIGVAVKCPKPTAGYALDARRWLDEARPLLDDADLESLVRLA